MNETNLVSYLQNKYGPCWKQMVRIFWLGPMYPVHFTPGMLAYMEMVRLFEGFNWLNKFEDLPPSEQDPAMLHSNGTDSKGRTGNGLQEDDQERKEGS